jgi:hypothetical protein
MADIVASLHTLAGQFTTTRHGRSSLNVGLLQSVTRIGRLAREQESRSDKAQTALFPRDFCRFWKRGVSIGTTAHSRQALPHASTRMDKREIAPKMPHWRATTDAWGTNRAWLTAGQRL